MDIGQVNRNISQYIKGSVIFEERMNVTHIGLLVKGRVIAENMGSKTIFYSGSFLGIHDTYAENYLSTYRALEDTILYLFEVTSLEQMYDSITSNTDYCGLVIASLCKQFASMYNSYQTLLNGANSTYTSILDFGKMYQEHAYRIKLEKDSIAKVYNVQEPESGDLDVMVDYYSELSTFTTESIRTFFAQGNFIVKYHMQIMSEMFTNLLRINQNLANYIVTMLDTLIGNSSESIFYKYADLALLAEKRGKSSDAVVHIIDQIIDSINECQNILESSTSKQVNINRTRMEEVYTQILSGATEELKYDEDDNELTEGEVIEQTRGALDILLNYSNVDDEVAVSFKKNIIEFRGLRDKLAVDDDTRALRRKLSEEFYIIYEAVFIKYYEDNNCPLVIDLFLNYGFVDELLIKEDQLYQLYKIGFIREGGKFKVYTILQWLEMIYEGQKAPSKNEYDQDYSEFLREQLVTKRINQATYNEQLGDNKLKLHFEVQNFFRYISRIANGRITTFVPFVYSDIFLGNIERLLVGAHKIEAALQKIMDIDFSLFYREISYINKDKKIEKEYIMQEVLPEFILVPTVGANSIMWQSISEKQRNTPARVVLPLFAEGNVNDMIMKVCAKFRWEMCRTVQGSTWNNIKYKSLTSEYADYIQFYRKNHELSEERKEKIKMQIQKCNNRTGDVFCLDYEAWIKGESQGAIRLNKVARRILAMYCPFERKIRAKLTVQPLFGEAIQVYELDRMKKARELSNHYKSLQNSQIELTQELINNLEFFQDM